MNGFRKTFKRVLSLVFLVAFAVGAAAILAQEGEKAKTVTERLGGTERGRAFVSTDKPMYRSGENVWGRAVVVSAFKDTLLESVSAVFQVLSPKGETVFTRSSYTQDGVVPFHWTVPAGMPGGEYTLKATFPNFGFPPSMRKFDIRAYRAPRFRTQINFLRKGYGPGEKVTATLSATRSEGGIPAGAEVTVIARVDGAEVYRGDSKIDAKGECTARFTLPETIREGIGSLAFLIRDGGVQETAVKTLPILLNRVRLDFYPEGGYLVAGLPARVFLEARDTRQKPADVSGRVIDMDGKTVATFTTEHEGRGRFAFTPSADTLYTAVLDKPSGNTQRFLLPEVKATGLTLRAASKVYHADQAFWFFVASTTDRKIKIALSRFEKEVAFAEAELEAGKEKAVAFFPPSDLKGVARVTLFDDEGLPRAERLVFVRPEREVRVEIKARPDTAAPGSPVILDIVTRDEEGNGVPAVVCLAVTDDSILEQIEKREQAPRLPEQILLENEVKELADAHVYLGKSEEAETSMDLLLGTQGWRRFAYFQIPSFLSSHGDAAKRAVAFRYPVERLRAEGGVRLGGAPGGRRDKGAEEEPGAEVEVENKVLRPPAAAPEPAKAEKLKKADMPAEMEDEEMPEKDAKRPAGRRRMLREMRVVVRRVYAHKSRPGRRPGERTDFTETLYWHAGLKTDKDGKAQVSFDLSDSITTFRVRADAITGAGILGKADALVVSRKAFYIEPKLPLEITAGDLVEVPVAVFNGTPSALSAKLAALLGPGLVMEGAEPTLLVKAGSSGRLYLTLVGSNHNGPVSVALTGTAGDFSDKVVREIPVVPYGFPMDKAFGGKLAGTASGEIVIPDSVVPASIVARAAVYPSPMATLTEALKGLLREPCGCFEQASSATYPNIMVMDYMESHHVSDSAVLKRCRSLLDKGYKRLVSFECKRKGYEWFGGDPGHEALTAYGLMEFRDMARVLDVDPEMMERTRRWLLERRDGKGGFKRNPRALDSFGGAPKEITNAYIVWSLLESGEKGLEKEIEAVKAHATNSGDPYTLALASNILLLAGDEGAGALLEKLASKQAADGAMRGAKTSITRSGGDTLVIETTSLAILAWLKSGKFTAQVEKAADWLFKRCKGGRFGSTQSTILALKAILGYDASKARPKAPGRVTLFVDGKEMSSIKFDTDTTGPLEFPPFTEALVPGKHTVTVKMEGGSEMPFAVNVRYNAATPANSPDCSVSLSTSLSTSETAEGETLEALVRLESRSEEGLPMTLAIIGLPGGVEVRHDQLKELVKRKKVDFYETRGREVILYWRSLAPRAVREVTLSLVAAVPGLYTGPASRAYLYYTDDLKMWCPGLKVKIRRSGE